MRIDEKNLLSRLKVDDEQALSELIQHFNVKLIQLANQFLHNHQIAEEMVMDTFINIWENRHKLPEINHMNWYLHTIVKNKCLNQLRSTKTRPFVDMDDIEVQVIPECSPEDLLISAENVQRINRAINALPPKCRQIFILVKEEQLKYSQVAELLQINIKTVENQMGIALKKIYQALTKSS